MITSLDSSVNCVLFIIINIAICNALTTSCKYLFSLFHRPHMKNITLMCTIVLNNKLVCLIHINSIFALNMPPSSRTFRFYLFSKQVENACFTNSTCYILKPYICIAGTINSCIRIRRLVLTFQI